MRMLVTGGTGKVGRDVAAGLRERGIDAVTAARRDADMTFDFADPDGYRAQVAGFDAAFLCTPIGPEETAQGLATVDILRAAGVGKIVALGIMNVEALRAIPHFEAKIPIRDAVLADGRSVVLSANYFFQNDLLGLAAIAQGGVYPMPIGSVGIYPVDTRDVAAAAVNALAREDWDGLSVPVCGREKLTGPGMAAAWSAALGRPVVYPGDALEPFLAVLERNFPGFDDWVRNDTSLMMQITQQLGCPADAAAIDAAAALIGAPQRAYTDFVAEAAALANELPMQSGRPGRA